MKKKREILRAIAAIELNSIPDNLISNYKDFLQQRDFLPFYQLNVSVLNNLITLATELWDTKQRISRLSLVTCIKAFGFKSTQDRQNVTLITGNLMLDLFRKVYENINYATETQREEILRIVNYCLLDLRLDENRQQWLTSIALDSTFALNRVLRYPEPSLIISSWIKENFKNIALSSRRAEAIGWILDMEPNYEITEALLWQDFHQLNAIDHAIMKFCTPDHEAERAVENTFGEYLTKKPFSEEEEQQQIMNKHIQLFYYKTENYALTKRFYSIPTVDNSRTKYPFDVPNYYILEDQFNGNIAVTFKVTMLWGIGYSRLSKTKKTQLMKRYYEDRVHASYMKVCQKFKLLKALTQILD